MTNTYSRTLSFKDYFSKTMFTMTIGLGISTIVAYLLSIINFDAILYSFGAISFVIVIGLCVAEIGVGIYFSSRLFQMSKQTAWTCFVAYSVLTGISLSSLVTYYSSASITIAFLTTTILFACMAFIGRTTKIDLTKFASLAIVGLLAMSILSIITIFVYLPKVTLFISYLGIIIFLFMIGYDVQKLEQFYNLSYDPEVQEKLMIMSAFQLYLDFINLFTRLLQMYGRSDNDRRR